MAQSVILANIIYGLHILLVIYILIGHHPKITSSENLPNYIYLVMIIFLDWNDFDGQCILTKLENYFRTGTMACNPPRENGPEFFRPIINKIFSADLTREQGDRLNNFIFMLCLLLAVSRLISDYQIDMITPVDEICARQK